MKRYKPSTMKFKLLSRRFKMFHASRGSLGKRVHEKIEKVKELIRQQGSFPDDIAIDEPPGRGITLPTEDARGRTKVKDQIWGYLMGDDVGMIGVCGPGGIGKTTFMENIHNDLLKESKFDKVVWARVPYPVNIVTLQDNIASNMQLPPLPKNERDRAATLSSILSKGKYVLILDDAWEWFSFKDVGIPQPTPQNECKAVITSGSVELCNEIGCEQVIRVQLLSEEESLNLFKDTVGHDVLLKVPNLEETLKLVVAECARLPLAIVVIARSMREAKDISAWKYGLFELQSRLKRVKGSDDKIFERLKFSYDRLNDAELKNCFLHCSLYPKGGSIQRHGLIKSWIDNGLIEQLETRKLMYYRANVILDSLINKCLIERVDCSSDGDVRMHDVMRDMAWQVAGPRFMVKAGLQLAEVPEVNEWTENPEKVLLQANRITDFASSMSLNCPKLSSLDLSWNFDLRQIPDSSFVHMLGLKFLTLSHTAIEALPDSISILENLSVLQLAYCWRLKYMPSLVNLKALKKLDLKRAGIRGFPQGMEMLVNLQHLNLDCPNLADLPMEILCNLTHLQFLAVALNSTNFVMKAEKVIRLKVSETFIGEFPDLRVFNNFEKSLHEDQKFTRYWLRVGSINDTVAIGGKMRLDEFEMGRDFSVLLLNDFQLLKIKYCSNVKILSENSLFNTATDLRYCEIDSCEGLECVLHLCQINPDHGLQA